MASRLGTWALLLPSQGSRLCCGGLGNFWVTFAGFWGFLLSFLEIFHEILARIAGILGLESRRLSRRNGFQIFELTFSGKNVFWALGLDYTVMFQEALRKTLVAIFIMYIHLNLSKTANRNPRKTAS